MECQNCGQPKGKRNDKHFVFFLGKPLCANWRACYRRKTGRTFYWHGAHGRRKGMPDKESIREFAKAAEKSWTMKHDHERGAHGTPEWRRGESITLAGRSWPCSACFREERGI